MLGGKISTGILLIIQLPFQSITTSFVPLTPFSISSSAFNLFTSLLDIFNDTHIVNTERD